MQERKTEREAGMVRDLGLHFAVPPLPYPAWQLLRQEGSSVPVVPAGNQLSRPTGSGFLLVMLSVAQVPGIGWS